MVVDAHQDQVVDVHDRLLAGVVHWAYFSSTLTGVTVSALSDRGLAESDKISKPVIELRRGGRAQAGSYLYEGTGLITGWHSHDVHKIEYAIGGVVEVETASAHYLLPPQHAAGSLSAWNTRRR